MRDTSLDDFAGGGEDGEEPSDGRGDADDGKDGAEAAERPDPAATTEDGDGGSGTVEPAVSTFEWAPDGATCGACGDDVERRWRDDGELVCASCKGW